MLYEVITVAVVVSAVGGVTDSLINTAKAAASQKAYLDGLATIKDTHKNIISELFSNGDADKIEKDLEPIWSELENILKGISLTGELSTRSHDTISGCGERLSSTIISYLIKDAKRNNFV